MMDKQSVIYLVNGISFTIKKQSIAACHNMAGLRKHYAV